MNRKWTLLLIVIVVVGIASCKKATSVENKSNGLLGTWNLVNIQVQSTTTTNATVSGVPVKAVTTANYTTTQNAGTITFTPDSLIGQGISYYDSTTATVQLYTAGVLTNTMTSPFVFSLPPTNSSANYNLVGSDSLYCQAGTILSGISSGIPSQPAGFKLALSGNTLLMTTLVSQSFPQTIQGITGTANLQATAIITLKKQ